MAIASGCTALFAGVQIWTNFRNDRERRKERLDDRLDALLALTVQYPYLEHETITKEWSNWKQKNKGKYDEKFIRYDQFANMLFNYLVDVYEFYGKDKKKIDDYLDVKGWVRCHQQIWKDPYEQHENADGYSDDFRDFINSYLR